MSNLPERPPCPKCDARAHRVRQWPSSEAAQHSKEWISCRVCGFNNKNAAALKLLAGVAE